MKYDLHMLEKECVMCLEDFIEGESVKLLPCFHPFHIECIKGWLLKQATCPICTSPV